MDKIPTTSKEIAVNELDKIIPPKLMKDYDCISVLVLVPKKNQDEPLPLIDLGNNTEFDTQSSFNSSIDVEENLIDFFPNASDDSVKESTPKLDTNIETGVLNLDVDELERLCLKMSEEKSKCSFHDNNLHSKATLTPDSMSSLDKNHKIIEIDDTTNIIFPKLNRSCSDTSSFNNGIEEKGNILIPKLKRISDTSNIPKITNNSDVLFCSLRNLIKTDSAIKYNDSLTKVDQAEISQVSTLGSRHSVFSKFDESPQNAFSKHGRNTLEKPDTLDRELKNFPLGANLNYNEVRTEGYTSNSYKKPHNYISSNIRYSSEMSDNGSLDSHLKDLTLNPLLVDEIAKDEDFDYDDLLDELSRSKILENRISNSVEPVRRKHIPISLTQPGPSKAVDVPYNEKQNAYLNELLNKGNPGDSNSSVITKPITCIPPAMDKSVERRDIELQRTYSNKLLHSRNKIQNNLMYYQPQYFYEPDPRNNDKYVLIVKTIKKNHKEYRKKRIITNEIDRAAFTQGPDFEEKQEVLPQIMEKLKEKKARMEVEKNLKKRLILGSGASVQNGDNARYSPPSVSSNRPIVTTESSVRLEPIVLAEDCNRERLNAFNKRLMFNYFMQTGSYI